MLRHYLIMALRGFARHELYTFINIADMTPFRDVHLTSDQYGGDMTPAGSWTVVYGLSTVALLIVLVAGCNFMNLATAQATLRAREIGLRKLEGARRRQLMVQFLAEALLTAFASLAIALSLAEILLPAYGRFLGEPMSLGYLTEWHLLVALIAGTAVVGLMSGAYPALVISALRPVEALKPGAGLRAGSGLPVSMPRSRCRGRQRSMRNCST